jgi:cation/acetate symporter
LRGAVPWFVLIATALPALGVLAKLDLLGRFTAAGGEPVANVFLHGARSGGAVLPLDGLGLIEPQAVVMALPALSGASGWLTGLFALSVMALLAVAGGGVLRMLLAVCVSRSIPTEARVRSRLIAAVTLFVAACLALLGMSVLTLGALAYALLGAAVFAPLLLALWWPRATGAGALAGMIGGTLTVVGFAAFGTSGIAFLPVGALGLLVSTVLTVAISLMTEPVAPPVEENQRPYGLIADPEVLE